MKSSLRAAAATSLAAALVVSGLASGPAALAAEPDAERGTATHVGQAGRTFSLVSQKVGRSEFWASVPGQSGLQRFSSQEAAEAAATTFLPVIAGYERDGTPLWVLYDADTYDAAGRTGKCAYTTGVGLFWGAIRTCDLTGTSYVWTWSPSGTWRSSLERADLQPVVRTITNNASGFDLGNPQGSHRWTTVPVDPVAEDPRPLTASVQETDVRWGKAVLSGGAPANATRIRVTYQLFDSTQSMLVDPDTATGDWSAEVLGLGPGSNPVRVEALEGATVIDRVDLDVDLAFTPPSAVATFPGDRAQNVTLAGRGQADSTIDVMRGQQRVGRTTVRLDGTWTLAIAAPGSGGDERLGLTQSLRGYDAGSGEVVVPYGPAVTITSPGEGTEIDPAHPELTVSGTGEAGAPVVLTNEGDYLPGTPAEERVLARGRVGDDGRYRLTTGPLPDIEQHLVVTQQGKGANTTRAELTVNPGLTGAPRFRVTNPDAAQIAAGYAPGGSYTFTGTGTPGSTVTVQNAKGLLLGTTKVGYDRTWSWTRSDMGAYTWVIDFVQDKGQAGQKTVRIADFKPAASAATPVVVTKPADVSVGYLANRPFTFEGTARAGATVTVQNAKGTLLGTTTADASGRWSWTRANMGTYAWTLDFIADKGQVTQQQARVAGFKPLPLGALALVDPDAARIQAGYAPNAPYTFRGVGKAGSTITIQNLKGLRLGTATVAADGTWSWTRADMGTYIWRLNFVQDQGTAAEQVLRLDAFGPAS
ncbi:Ig-like domain-containing protein [Frigoribacterium salinisoli]